MSSHDLSTGDEEPRRAAERSDAVVRTLVENHRAFLRFLERRVGSHETAEDILQEAFGRAVRHADSLEDAESAVAWFYRLLRNAVIDHYRRSATAAAALERFAGEVEPSVPPLDMRDEICACVARLASSLKPEYAAALAEVEVQGMPIKAFAEAHGLTANNASVRLFRAREALRRQVVAACGTCAEHGCVDCRCGRPRRN